MILAIDMGNSNIVVGGIDDERTYFEERITTDDRKTSLEYAIMLKNIMEIHNIRRNDIEGAIISPTRPSVRGCQKNNREKTSSGRLRYENRPEYKNG